MWKSFLELDCGASAIESVCSACIVWDEGWLVATTGANQAQATFLEAARVGHLGTVDTEGRPHVVPICFAVLGDGVYSPLDEKPKQVAIERLRRVRNILANRSVCLMVDRYSEDWGDLAWVQVRGEASLVPPGSERHAAAVRALRRRYPQYRAMRLDERPLIRIAPLEFVSWRV